MDIKQNIITALLEFFTNNGVEASNIFLETPKDSSLGDFSSTVALKYSKQMGKNPRELATLIADYLKNVEGVSDVNIAGPGFLNISISQSSSLDFINKILNEDEITLDTFKGRKANVEYVSANPTGNLHLGHGRNAAFGSAIVSILRKVGYQVESEYWINDYGNQMDNLALSIFCRYKELFGLEGEIPEDGYVSADVIEVAKKIKESHGDKFLNMEESQMIQEIRILGCEIYLERIKKVLSQFNTNLDKYSSESKFYANGDVDRIINTLEQKEEIYDSEGAKWFKSTNYGDDKDRVVIKNDGNYTYMCGDMALHEDKFKRGYDLYINVWGADHHGYIPRLKGLIDSMGYDSSKLQVPLIQLVQLLNDEGKIEKMSKRKGNAITVPELIDMVGVDSARYFFLMKPNNTHLNFDVKLATEQSSSNPIFYIQYAQTRINSVLKRSNIKDFSDADLSNLSKQDLDIVSLLMKYEDVLVSSAKELAPHKLCNYLYDLSSKLHKLYNNSIFISDDEAKTKDYLKLISAVRTILIDGLKTLGLSTPEVM